MSYSVYKVIHLIGVFMVLISIGAAIIHMANGGEKQHPSKKFLGMTHGIGLLISLVGGFGLAARLGLVTGLPGWIYAKLAIWLFFGGITAVIYKKPQLSKLLWFVLIAVAGLAAYLAQYKPF